METVSVKNLTFQYPNSEVPALRELSLSVREGEVLLICGPSGCGKTTLLRHLKPLLTPKGTRSGELHFCGAPLSALSEREAARRIGLLRQDVDAQLVMDTVRAELAFGLEQTGIAPQPMRRRIAETVSFLGIQELYHRPVQSLSGGEKQRVSLAAVMAMQPELLLLDEPSAQLDPIAAAEFYDALLRVNRELGTTVILTEQRLDEAFALVDRVAVMSKGELLFSGSPQAAAAILAQSADASLRALLPLPAKLTLRYGGGERLRELPVTVREARAVLADTAPPQEAIKIESPATKEPLVRLKELSFRFTREGRDVLRDLSFAVAQGELLCILGGNGVGKTTLLRVLNGALKPYRGKIRWQGGKLPRLAYLPQNPRLLFARDTLAEDFSDVSGAYSAGKRFALAAELQKAEKLPQNPELEELLAQTGLSHLTARHPYDLSAGEQQRAALVKLLLTQPELLLLDEPTKGLDARNREILADFLRAQTALGRTVIAVTHDVEFAASSADRCALLFDGELSDPEPPQTFLRQNLFYTTVERRIFRAGNEEER